MPKGKTSKTNLKKTATKIAGEMGAPTQKDQEKPDQPGAGLNTPDNAQTSQPEQPVIDPQKQLIRENFAKSHGTACVTVATYVNVCKVIGGDEWKATAEEIKMMETAFTKYYVAHGIRELPPSVEVVIALGAYTIPRFRKPKTKKKIDKFVERISNKWKLRKGSKIEKQEPEKKEKLEPAPDKKDK